jgi:hypothetical protein
LNALEKTRENGMDTNTVVGATVDTAAEWVGKVQEIGTVYGVKILGALLVLVVGM